MGVLESQLSATFSVHFLVVSEFCRSWSDLDYKLNLKSCPISIQSLILGFEQELRTQFLGSA